MGGIQADQHILYRLLGNLWLPPPQKHLDFDQLQRLHVLEPMFRYLESQPRKAKAEEFDLEKEFQKFASIESSLWNPPRSEQELTKPDGSLCWPLAHHLHIPSFATLIPYKQKTADPSNPCTWQIMANSYTQDKTLIFDHLARREASDAFTTYPSQILSYHEEWLQKIRRNMAAYVEVIYGRHVEKRARQTLALEEFKLWGPYRGVNLHLEWEDNILVRVIIFATHPQYFCQPWGKRLAPFQDRLLTVAHLMARLPYETNFYQDLSWTFIHKFPRRYPGFIELSRAAHQAVINNTGSRDQAIEIFAKTKKKPGTWNCESARHNQLKDPDVNSFLRLRTSDQVLDTVSNSSDRGSPLNSGTKSTRDSRSKISKAIKRDSTKPAKIEVKCKDCSKRVIDEDPRWHIKTGKYVAKKRVCTSESCSKQRVHIPTDVLIKHIQYDSVAVRISKKGKPYFRPWIKGSPEPSLQYEGLRQDALENSSIEKN